MDSLLVAIMLSAHTVPEPVVRNAEIRKPEIIASIPTREPVEVKPANIWDVEGN